MQQSEYSEIAETEAFKELVRWKRAFLIPTVVFVLLFFIICRFSPSSLTFSTAKS